MKLESLTELSNSIKNRIDFFMLSTQDMLVEELNLDDSSFEVKDGVLYYNKEIQIVYSPIGQRFDIYNCYSNSPLATEVSIEELVSVFSLNLQGA